MRTKLIENVRERFKSMSDIVVAVEGECIDKTLSVPKNKSVGDHMWCIVGARESYSKALIEGAWAGFNCSLTGKENAKAILSALDSSANEFEKAIASIREWSDERDSLLVSLFEHEVMHEGQLIRQLYGLNQTVPKSVKWA